MLSCKPCSAGIMPVSKPNKNIKPTPNSIMVVDKFNPGNVAAIDSAAPLIKNFAKNNPAKPPINEITMASANTMIITAKSENPSVFKIANSGIRSRKDCAMVLPATNNMVKNTAPNISVVIKPISPNCLAKDLAKSFSLLVLVSAGELAKSASTAAATCADCLGSLRE